MANSSSKSTGIGIPTILFIVFLVLKLTNNIDWSWWWVTSPLWIPFALFFAIVAFVILIFIIAIIFGVDVKSKTSNWKGKIESLKKK